MCVSARCSGAVFHVDILTKHLHLYHFISSNTTTCPSHRRLREAAYLQRKLSLLVGGGAGASSVLSSSTLAQSLLRATGAARTLMAAGSATAGAATNGGDGFYYTANGGGGGVGSSTAMLARTVIASAPPEPLSKRIERLEVALAFARDPSLRVGGGDTSGVSGSTGSGGGSISQAEVAVWEADLTVMRLQADVLAALRTLLSSTVAGSATREGGEGGGAAGEASFLGDSSFLSSSTAGGGSAAASDRAATITALSDAILALETGPIMGLTDLYRYYAKRFGAHDACIAILDAGGRKPAHEPLVLDHWRALIAEKLTTVSEEVAAAASSSTTAEGGRQGAREGGQSGPSTAIAVLKRTLGDLGRRLITSNGVGGGGGRSSAAAAAAGGVDPFSFTFPVRFLVSMLESHALGDGWPNALAPGYPYGEL